MLRRLFTFLAALSLLLCLATLLLWSRSRRVADCVFHIRPDGCHYVRGCPNHIVAGRNLYFGNGPPPTELGLSFEREEATPASEFADTMVPRGLGREFGSFENAGFAWREYRSTDGQRVVTVLAIPFWSIVLLTAVAPIAWASAHVRRRKRDALGLCPRCRYDLRATAGRCPECGHEPAGR